MIEIPSGGAMPADRPLSATIEPVSPALAVDAKGLARMLGVSLRHIRAMNSAGKLSRTIRVGAHRTVGAFMKKARGCWEESGRIGKNGGKATATAKNRALKRIQAAVSDHRYTLSGHAYEKMDAEGLDALDVEAAISTGRLEKVLTHDSRGVRYTIVGMGCDQATPVGIVARFVENDDLLVITVYEIR